MKHCLHVTPKSTKKLSRSTSKNIKRLSIALFSIVASYSSFGQTACLPDTSNDVGFSPIGDLAIIDVTTDGDNGDGVGDGALLFDGQSAVANLGGVYRFSCVMVENEPLSIATYVYNPRSSYVKLKVTLHNVTDDKELASTKALALTSSNSNVNNFSLNYTPNNDDNGDELELRYIRTDGGHTARDFAVDNATLNGQPLQMTKAPPSNPACSAPIVFNTDIALTSATPKQVADVDKIYTALSDRYVGTDDDVDLILLQSRLNQALIEYDALNIVVAGGSITGNAISYDKAGKLIKTFAQHLKLVGPNDVHIAEKASNIVWLVSQKLCDLDIKRDYNSYSYREFARNTMHLKNYLSDEIKDIFGYTLNIQSGGFLHFWGDYQAGVGYNTDWMHNMGDSIVLFGLWKTATSNDERVQWLKASKRYLERFLTFTNGTSDGLKPDGSGFHHWAAYDGYMYAMASVISIIGAFDDTSFQIDTNAYKNLRDFIYAQRMMSNDSGIKALSMVGRNPHIKTISTTPWDLRQLAVSGGGILGLSTADPVLAGYYNRTWDEEPLVDYSKKAEFESGFIQLNHANAGVARQQSNIGKGDWLAVFNGFSDNMMGSELYSNANRYGRYQSYGSLEVIYPGDNSVGNNGFDVQTWNWNYNPGTTTIVLPWERLHGERSRIDEKQQKRFVGSLAFDNKGAVNGTLKDTFGTYGMFAMDFQEQELGSGFGTVYGPDTHNTSFTFKKSNFAFGDIIVSLASDINNDDGVHSTVTTLYQRLADSQSAVEVNSATYSSEGMLSFTGDVDNWVIDNWVIDDYQTGFYVVAGSGDLKVWQGVQQTPNHKQVWPTDISQNAVGEYTIGYIDHGTAPQNSGYEYITIPNATIDSMDKISAKKPYIVYEKNNARHVIKHTGKNIWAYALFQASSNMDYVDSVLKGSDASCLVMYKNLSKKHIRLSVVDPDIGFTARNLTAAEPKQVQLTLHGKWKLANTHPKARIINVGKKITILEFDIEQGLPVEVNLIQRKRIQTSKLSR